MDFGSPVIRANLYRSMWDSRPADDYNQQKGWDPRPMAAETAATLRPHASATPQMMANAPLTPPSDNDTVPSPRNSPISPASQQNQEKSLPNDSENVEHRRSSPTIIEDTDPYQRLFQSQKFMLTQEQNNNSMDASSLLPKEHLKSLENMVLPTSSPDDSCSGSDNGKSPTIGGSSKQKTFKCKQCGHISDAKIESYRHNKIHLRPDKILICKICEFCTEFKHHFEYHMRNHEGTKPFKCDQCSYSCVNRSMLTSHQKSHSSVYQYRCKTCGYSAKYMHALKQHLKKNDHEPGLVLNADGSVNPYPIIDVYGSRRGPRKTPNSPKPTPSPIGVPLVGPNGIFPMSPEHLSIAVAQLRFRQMLEHAASTAIQNGAIAAMPTTDTLSREQALALSPERQSTSLSPHEAVDTTLQRPRGTEVLDLSRWKSPEIKQEQETDEENEEDEEHKDVLQKLEKDAEMTDDEEMIPSMCVEANYVPTGMCKHCNIQFGNMIMHQIHMGYHSHGNPLVCNKCGHSFGDSIQFFSHIGMSCKPSQS